MVRGKHVRRQKYNQNVCVYTAEQRAWKRKWRHAPKHAHCRQQQVYIVWRHRCVTSTLRHHQHHQRRTVNNGGYRWSPVTRCLFLCEDLRLQVTDNWQIINNVDENPVSTGMGDGSGVQLYQPKGGDALWLGSKSRHGSCVCGRQNCVIL